MTVPMPVITTTYVLDLTHGAGLNALDNRIPVGAHVIVVLDDRACCDTGLVDRIGAVLWDAASINIQAPARHIHLVVGQIRRRIEGVVELETQLREQGAA
ncbi:hypothetical protein [Embleya sp. NPDC001921]